MPGVGLDQSLARARTGGLVTLWQTQSMGRPAGINLHRPGSEGYPSFRAQSSAPSGAATCSSEVRSALTPNAATAPTAIKSAAETDR